MPISIFTDQHYLQTEQYATASNLNARRALHDLYSVNKNGWMPWVFDQLDLPAGALLLELGCGPANLWLENLARLPAACRLVLSDFSPGMLQAARANLSQAPAVFTFGQVDAQAIPFGPHTFDLIVANHMLYHVPDLDRALAEIRRVLKPGGRLYATTIGRDHVAEIGDLVRRFSPHDECWRENVVDQFLLENGGAALSRWFSQVNLHRYPDELLVTAAGPLLAYILSTTSTTGVPLAGDNLAALSQHIESELAAHGAIHISKDSGIFIAY